MLYLWIFFSSLLILATIFGLFAKKHWFFDLWTHFQVQYFVLVVILIPLAPFHLKREYLENILFLGLIICIIINGKEILPYLKYKSPQPPLSRGSASSPLDKGDLGDCVFKILFQNIYKGNLKTNKFINLIENETPDIIAIVEYTDCHDLNLKVIKEKYKHFWGICLDNGFGMALFSKYKFELIYKGGFDYMPFTIFKNFHPNKTFLFTIFHPSPPMCKTWAKAFETQIKELEYKIQNLNQDMIIVGDFNASPWGWHFKNFIKKTKLKDPRKTFGFNFSWMRLSPFCLPIDHILSSQNFEFLDFKICKSVASDHRGILAEIKIKN